MSSQRETLFRLQDWSLVRDQAGESVTVLDRIDLVLERDVHTLAGVEVKAAATFTAADFRGLRKLASATGKRLAAGVVLYDGEGLAGYRFGDRLTRVSS